MSVKVRGSDNDDAAIIKLPTGSTYYVKNTDPNESVTILANASGVTKTDTIVGYVDLTAGDEDNAGSPGAFTLIAVRRSGTNTGAPTDGEIDAATSNNPWFKLANITVVNGETQITGGMITDLRVRAKVWLPAAAVTVDTDAIVNESVGNNKLKTGAGQPGGAWTAYTPTWTGSSSNPIINNGSIAGSYTKVGRTVTAKIILRMGSTTTYGGGEMLWTLPVTPITTNSTHLAVGRYFLFDASASTLFSGDLIIFSSDSIAAYANKLGFKYQSATTGSVSNCTNTAPITLANGDYFTMLFTYEAAA